MTGMFPNGQLVVFPPVTRASMPPYVNHEIWTREALLGYHYGEIPYCGVRGNKGEPLPANPRTDASLLDTIPPEKESTFPYRFDHYSAPRVDAMPAAITGESVAYAEDEQVAAGVTQKIFIRLFFKQIEKGYTNVGTSLLALMMRVRSILWQTIFHYLKWT